MKIFFVMQYPGYLRYFDGTLRLLAERGHHVQVAFDSPHKQPEGLEALAGADRRIEVVGRPPIRKDCWKPVAARVRGTIDYARYLHPEFSRSAYLRGRMEKALAPEARLLARIRQLEPDTLASLLRGLQALEEAIPVSEHIDQYFRRKRPDIVLVTPLVTDGSTQVDLIKGARALGIPTGLCVASWDHLTTKGLIRVQPDLVAVWNEIQRDEAQRFHAVPASRIVITGAQPFDRWFDRTPGLTRDEFCARVGLGSAQPFVLFVGSTASISAPAAEVEFVRRWVRTIRRSSDPRVRDMGLLVRPHPYNSAHWRTEDISDMPNVAVWPRHQANPVKEGDRDDYYHSLYFAEAVVGINTSAMIEAAIVGRPVLSILSGEFQETQTGTLHFRYLLPEYGGFVKVATTVGEHLRQLSWALANPNAMRAQIARFVKAFIRPAGLETPSTPQLVEAIEKLGTTRVKRREMPRSHYPLRGILRVYAGALQRAGSRPRGEDGENVDAN
jgi:hypothetical protein